ncbi:hypothetical protein KKG41_04255 [Patescibacteria group bacterium]|nr:hypothetical protein [Patescibacteria group bacterium]MBU1890980.1 hypothetical protein [Patescibacteria group bacterium]
MRKPMYINKITENEFKRFNNLPVSRLIQLRRHLDKELYKNDFYLKGHKDPIPVKFNCVFLTRKQSNDLSKKCEILFGAIQKIVDEYYKSKGL